MYKIAGSSMISRARPYSYISINMTH